MRLSLASSGLAVAAVLSLSSARADTHSEEQERLCTGDAFRLCSAEIPNEDRIVACMTRLRSQLSPACRAVFDDPAPADTKAARVRPRKPTQLVPE